MIDGEVIGAAVKKYVAEYDRFNEAATRTAKRVLSIADGARIKCSVVSRAKDPRSFQKKAIAKQYTDPWKQITDKAGVRAVVQSPRDVDRLCSAMELELGADLLRIEDKRQVTDPARLGCGGVHVQALAPADHADSTRIECEIQIRTAAQDAWSIVSHQVLYKPLLTLPQSVQHAAYRLVALVEMFDEEVQRIMDTLAEGPGNDVADLIDIAEGQFLDLAHSAYNPELTVLVLQTVAMTLDPSERESYRDLLAAFVDTERQRLTALFKEYGPHSEVSYIPDYVLLGQPESIVLLERLTARPHLLANTWQLAGMPESYLQALAGAAGLALP